LTSPLLASNPARRPAMNQTLIATPRVRPETASALRDMALVLTLTQRVRVEMKREAARR
jgi:hypothetical protein